MTGPSEDIVDIQTEPITAAIVCAWLRRHPEFLDENPEVIAFLTPPAFQQGETILDMQRFLLDRMRHDLVGLRRREKQLLAAVEGNSAGQAKIHQAVLAVIRTTDIHALNRVICADLPSLLDIEAAVLCIEEPGAMALAGATPIGLGGIGNLMGPKRRIILQEDTRGEAIVFGNAADRVKSIAYLRLRTQKNAPAMLLALGSGRDDGFNRHQATDLISFLAQVIAERLKTYLGPKN